MKRYIQPKVRCISLFEEAEIAFSTSQHYEASRYDKTINYTINVDDADKSNRRNSIWGE